MFIYVMTTFLNIAAGGAGALVYSFANAPVGFEDDLGFHADPESSTAREIITYSGHDRRRSHKPYSGPRRRSSDFGAGPLLSGA